MIRQRHWEQIVSLAEGRNATPSVIIIYVQSIKTTEAGGAKGYDAGKKFKGRRHRV